jgi:hypothetical protein
MATKKFTSKPAVRDDKIVIELNDQTFKCNDQIDGMTLMEFAAKVDPDNPLSAAGSVGNFFQAAIVPEDWKRFMAYTKDPKNGVSVETLGEIAGWLAGEYMDVPTVPAESSSAG